MEDLVEAVEELTLKEKKKEEKVYLILPKPSKIKELC